MPSPFSYPRAQSQCDFATGYIVKSYKGYKGRVYNVVTLATVVTFLTLLHLIQRSPAVPRQRRTIWCKSLSLFHHLLRRRQFSFPENFREPFTHPIIVYRPDIRTPQVEKQQHFYRPTPNSAHLDQPLNNFVVGHFGHGASRRHRAVNRFRRQIFQRRDFTARQTGCAQCFIGRFQHHLRIEKFSPRKNCAHPFPNGSSRFSAQLLVSDRFGQSIKCSHLRVWLNLVATGMRDQLCQSFIARRKMAMRFVMIHGHKVNDETRTTNDEVRRAYNARCHPERKRGISPMEG